MDAAALKFTICPTFTPELGVSDWITTVGAEPTVMVSVALALWPNESFA